MIDLERPLIVFDVETTGVNAKRDRIIELGLIKLFPDGSEKEWSLLFNPRCPIPPELTENVHHISDEMVKDSPFFEDKAETIAKGFVDCDICGFNVDFDLRFLRAELNRAVEGLGESTLEGCRVIDPYRIYTKRERRNLAAAYRLYAREEMDANAHRALYDAGCTLAVLRGQLAHYPDLPRTVAGLVAATKGERNPLAVDEDGKFIWRFGEAYFTFGKFEGMALRSADRGYLTWMINGQFSDEVKEIARNAKDGKFPVKETK